jgi:hypothetical protein
VFDFGIHFHFVAVVFSAVPMNYNYLWWENVSLRRKQIVLILAARRLSGGRQGQPVRSGGWPGLILRPSLVQAGPGFMQAGRARPLRNTACDRLERL